MRNKLFLSQSPTLTLFPYLLWFRLLVICTALISGWLSAPATIYWWILAIYLLLLPACLQLKARLSGINATAILLCVDVFVLSFFIHLNQGVLSGWVSALLVPTVLAALALPRLLSWVITLICVLCYTLLIALYLMPSPSPHMHLHAAGMSDHMLGMMITFWVSAFLITAFITAQARIVRHQHQQLMQQQQRQLRDEQIMAVATLTANAAHHLATPLASAQMLTDELCDLASDRTRLQAQEILNQLHRCKQALDKVIQQGKSFDPLSWQSQQVESWLTHLCENWWLTHNEVQFTKELDEQLSRFSLRQNDSLDMAISTLLDNAARACQHITNGAIQLHAHVEHNQLILRIMDNGEGIDTELEQQLGKGFVQSQGNGIGFALANASIEQAGGKVNIEQLSPGAAVTVTLPVITTQDINL
ncbi:sensor histidine kinase [Neptunicella marina]|uniref:histidine kinase n=1 Tax=Neptunicella marina TaxID=2125989 RepID=A0A8J6M388_9ALTE|nr:HAMP domain-containing sensor histidine kinase [Neptunicella marina]MBC3765171.1 HAMP domain-containing histidine kinase [Neptunicella marina]